MPILLIVSLSQFHIDIAWFIPWSSFATGNNLDRAERILNVAQMTGIVDILILV